MRLYADFYQESSSPFWGLEYRAFRFFLGKMK
jgi:hypothetical protein